MTIRLRSKKMADLATRWAPSGLLDLARERWSGSAMNQGPADGFFQLTRRGLLAGLGGALLVPSRRVQAASRPSLTLPANPVTAALRSGSPDTPIWSLSAATPDRITRFRRGDEIDVTLDNGLPVP